MNNVRVIMIEPANVDVTQASKRGRLTYVFNGQDRRSSIWTPSYIEEVMARLYDMEYDPHYDFIVVAGHLVQLAIVLPKLTALYGTIRVLLWHAEDRDYRERLVGDEYCPVPK